MAGPSALREYQELTIIYLSDSRYLFHNQRRPSTVAVLTCTAAEAGRPTRAAPGATRSGGSRRPAVVASGHSACVLGREPDHAVGRRS